MFIEWARRDLKRGDLSALSEVAKGYSSNHEADRIERLQRRGFIKVSPQDKLRPTFTGRAALWLRRHSRHP